MKSLYSIFVLSILMSSTISAQVGESFHEDSFEFVHTTPEGNVEFNNKPAFDAIFLADDFPTTMTAGATQIVQVTIRNEGNLPWTNAEGISLQLMDPNSGFICRVGEIDDESNEVVIFGGITQGHLITFELELTAPDLPGLTTTNWQMVHDGEPFGFVLTVDIEIVE